MSQEPTPSDHRNEPDPPPEGVAPPGGPAARPEGAAGAGDAEDPKDTESVDEAVDPYEALWWLEVGAGDGDRDHGEGATDAARAEADCEAGEDAEFEGVEDDEDDEEDDEEEGERGYDLWDEGADATGGASSPGAGEHEAEGSEAKVELDADQYLSCILRLGSALWRRERERRFHMALRDRPLEQVLGSASAVLPAMQRYERAHPEDPIVRTIAPLRLSTRQKLGLWVLIFEHMASGRHEPGVVTVELAAALGLRTLASLREFDAAFGVEGSLREAGVLRGPPMEPDAPDPLAILSHWPYSAPAIVRLVPAVWARMVDGRLPGMFTVHRVAEDDEDEGERRRPTRGPRAEGRKVGRLIESVPERPLVLPPREAEEFDRALEAVPLRKTVAVDMGYGELLGYGLGTIMLFEGPPGTGKTLAAHVVAQRLGRPLLVVGAADLMDCWVGSTEGATRGLFARAERAGAVLLIDEADSMLRTRAAAVRNWELSFVNTLLRCIEHATGVVVLTTNFVETLDPALARRLTLRLRFPEPGLAERAQIWRALTEGRLELPAASTPDRLAHFDMNGSQIKSAVLDLALCAAKRQGRVVTVAEVERAVARARATKPVREPLGFEPPRPGQDEAST